MTYRIQASRLSDHVTIDLPASKSLSNRALILQGLCAAACRLHNLSDCDDTRVMLRAMETLATQPSGATIDIGAAGTAMRFLTAYLATREHVEATLTGSERMRHRPIALLVDALRSLGADIEYAEAEGYPPLKLRGRRLDGGDLSIDGSVSSQYISALLMIAPTLSRGLRLTLRGVVTSEPYIRMTLAMMSRFGVASEWRGDVISIAPQAYAATDYSVESDWSAASYWYEIVALCADVAGAGVRLNNLWRDSLQGDAAVSRYFGELGVSTDYDAGGVRLRKTGNAPAAVTWNLAGQPDLAQTLVATCCALGVHFDIDGLHTLRIKETDRIAALEAELRKLGFVVGHSDATDADGRRHVAMHWHGERCAADEAAPILTYDDHRMAMALAPLATVAASRYLAIDAPEVVSKSYPAFWQHLRAAGFKIVEE